MHAREMLGPQGVVKAGTGIVGQSVLRSVQQEWRQISRLKLQGDEVYRTFLSG